MRPSHTLLLQIAQDVSYNTSPLRYSSLQKKGKDSAEKPLGNAARESGLDQWLSLGGKEELRDRSGKGGEESRERWRA